MKLRDKDLLTQEELLTISQQDLEHLQRQVGIAMQKTLEEGWTTRKNDPSRVTRLRLSNFPFCGLQWFMSLPGSTSNWSHTPFAKSYFTSVGTTVHTVFQEALGNLCGAHSIEVIRDWKCLSCGAINTLQRKPIRCQHCGEKKDFEPMEVTVEHGLMLGHVDEILQITIHFKGKLRKIWVVIDYKTTSLSGLAKKHLLQDRGYIAQLSAYVGLLRKKNYPAAFGVLVYVPRDNPFKLKFFFVKVSQKSTLNRMRMYLDQFRSASTVMNDESLWKLVKERPCKTQLQEDFKGCKWATACVGKQNSKGIFFHAQEAMNKVKSRLPIVSQEHLNSMDKEL